MPNVFFKAKYLWDVGDRKLAFLMLNNYFENKLECPVFQHTCEFYEIFHFGQPNNFYTEVALLVTTCRLPEVSFCCLFSEIWDLDPHQRWINILLNTELCSDYYLAEPSEKLRKNADFKLVTELLVKAALKGILGDNPNEEPFVRRAVLPIDRIQEVGNSAWGTLKEMLLERLPEAYSACPPDFWAQLALREPEEVVMRFFHDVFLDIPVETAELRWKSIIRYHPSYADAIHNSLRKLLTLNGSPNWLTTMVKIDAGFTLVNDGAAWLESLSVALKKVNFKTLLHG